MRRVLLSVIAVIASVTAATAISDSDLLAQITSLFPSNAQVSISTFRSFFTTLVNSKANKAGDTFTGPIVARTQNVLTGAVARSTPPSANGNWNSITTAFTGADLSTVSTAIAHSITGATTLGQPATGYLYTNEAYPNLVYVYNSSGWNQSTSGNDGRTAAVAQKVQIYQHGQGDMVGLNVNGFVDSARAGATSWLASPNITIVNGTLQAGVAGAFLNGSEMDLVDSGFDVSGLTLTSNLNRTNNTGALGTYWGFLRGQSIGSKPVDDFLSATGPWNRGLNFAYTNFGTNQAAIVTAQSQRWYGNAAGSDPNGLNGITLGTDWIERSQFGFWNFVYNNASAFQINDTQVTALPAFQANKGVNVSSGYSYQINGINIADYSSRYGVKCDGTTDDTTAMQNFINAVQNSATSLGLGTGVGVINSGGSDGECIVSGLTITRPLTLTGLGSSSTSLRLKAGSTTPLFTISVAYATTNYYSLGFLPARVTLKNMRLSSTDGATGSANAHGIALVNNGTNPIYTNVTLDDVEVWKMSGAGLYAHSWNGGLQAKNLWVWYSHGHNVDLASVADFRFRGMDLASAGSDNLNISGVTESTCIDCNIYAATRFNVNAFGATNFTFEGNSHFDIAGQYGVYSNLNSSGWLRFIGSTHRWSSQAATATYSDIYAETGSAGAIYLVGAHFASGNGGYSGTPHYKLELNAASTTKFVVDPTTVFEDGDGTLAAVSNNPGAIFGGGSGTVQVLPLTESATLAANTTYYLGPLGSTTTNTLGPFSAPGACVVTGLRMGTTQFPGAGQSYTYTLFKNGSATGMTGSISGAAANTLSLAGSITFAANDNFQLRAVTSATATAAFHNGSLLMRCWL